MPPMRIELTTFPLQVECSKPTELQGLSISDIIFLNRYYIKLNII